MIDEKLKMAEIQGLQPTHKIAGLENDPPSQTIVCEHEAES